MAQYKTKKRGKPEAVFRDMIILSVPKHRGEYVIVPDEKALKERLKKRIHGKGYTLAADKRPYDGNLIFYNNTICVELKADDNKLEPHQQELGERLENMYDHNTGERPDRLVWCVLRRKRTSSGEVYIVENSQHKEYYRTDSLDDMLAWLKNYKPSMDNKHEKELDKMNE